MQTTFQIGTARRGITPPPGVELAGLGYYLNRTWERVRDDLAATALVIGDDRSCLALVALDLMYNEARFTLRLRGLPAAQTDIQTQEVCVKFSHSHNAPTAGLPGRRASGTTHTWNSPRSRRPRRSSKPGASANPRGYRSAAANLPA